MHSNRFKIIQISKLRKVYINWIRVRVCRESLISLNSQTLLLTLWLNLVFRGNDLDFVAAVIAVHNFPNEFHNRTTFNSALNLANHQGTKHMTKTVNRSWISLLELQTHQKSMKRIDTREIISNNGCIMNALHRFEWIG